MENKIARDLPADIQFSEKKVDQKNINDGNINDLTIPFLTLFISRFIVYNPQSSIRGDTLYKLIQKYILFLQENGGPVRMPSRSVLYNTLKKSVELGLIRKPPSLPNDQEPSFFHKLFDKLEVKKKHWDPFPKLALSGRLFYG
jgi:hypothetical protein